MRPEELRQRAEQYRALAVRIDDPLAHKALLDLAGEYEARAETAERQEEPDNRQGNAGGGSR